MWLKVFNEKYSINRTLKTISFWNFTNCYVVIIEGKVCQQENIEVYPHKNQEGTEQIKQCECIWSTKANTDIHWFYFEIAQFMVVHIFNGKIYIHYQNGMPLTRPRIMQHLNIVKYSKGSVNLMFCIIKVLS